MNPLMRVFIERSEWLFAAVKGATLLVSWYVMSRYARVNPQFVRTACLAGSAFYVFLWTSWFLAAR